jgi:hypothetical protein
MSYTCHFNFFIGMMSIVNCPLQHSICYKKSKNLRFNKSLINIYFLIKLGEETSNNYQVKKTPNGYYVIYHQVWVEKCLIIIR